MPIDQIFPARALLLGAGVLIGIVLVHAFFMRGVLSHVAARESRLRRTPTEWKVDLVMITVVFALAAALSEIVLWTASLKYAGLFSTWASAAGYAATTYTTLGEGRVRDLARASPPVAVRRVFQVSSTTRKGAALQTLPSTAKENSPSTRSVSA